MSCITENTIVIKNNDIEKFWKAINDNKNQYGWINNVEDVFSNEELSIFVFDCNGEPIAIEEQICFLVLETNYLDGEPLHTQIYDIKNKTIRDARYRAKYWIKNMIGDASFNAIQNGLVYTDGRA